MKKFKIRNIKKHHKGKIHKLIEEINREDILGYSLTDEWLDYVIDNCGEGIFLAFHGERLVGLGTSMINSVYRNQGALNLVVSPAYRNQGLGSTIYNKIYEYARMKDVNIVEAYVKERLSHGVDFAINRGFNIAMYSWQMELGLDSIDVTFPRKGDLNFRKAGMADGGNYRRIIKDGFGDDLGEDGLVQALRDSSVEVYILEKEGQAIGSATIQLKKDLSWAYIYDIAILRDCRGQGLGSYLLQSCIMALKEIGIGKASLSVAGVNQGALRLYERIGFKKVDIDLIMTKEI